VLQETYSKIWEAAADFDREKGSPLAWMATIARNLAIDQARRARPLSLDSLSEAYEPAADFEDPLAGRERQEAYAALLRCLTGLEPKMREMVLLAYYRGASRPALAAKFNIPVGTVKTWLRRTLAQLKDCLSS
jgi:RNA polymerase sigma-70 factor, ECF subfamily